MSTSALLNQPPTDPHQPYVFISYARRDAPNDQAVAEQLEACLLAAGVHCFRDVNIPKGDEWNQAINAALKSCNRMVLLLSSASMATDPYRKEVYVEWFPFDQSGKKIYPLLLEDCDRDRRFIGINHIDARTDVPAAINELLKQIESEFALAAMPPAHNALTAYYRERVAEWSQPRYLLDKRFVNLTLILDQGKDNPHRWQDEDARFDDLRDVLAKEKDGQIYSAFVLLGAPGSGKSTLLRRLQLDHSLDRLRDGGEQISFFTQLNEYRAAPGKALLPPREWLTEQWKKAYPLEKYPLLAPLETYLKTGRVLLLLDALNEMPHRSAEHYFELVEAWQAFTQAACAQGNRLVYSCRSLDYSASLSSDERAVPHIRAQPMTEPQVEQFLLAYCAAHAERILEELREQPQDKRQAQMELYQTPYFLKLLCDQVQTSSQIPKGRAALFTGYVREILDREVKKKGELSRPGALLTEDDFTDITQGFDERQPFALPEEGLLLPKLSQLAFGMQQTGNKTDGAHISKTKKEVYGLLAHDQAKAIYDAGMALNILDTPDRINIKFFHQLLQEYFAARHLKQEPNPSLVRVEWKADKVSPALAEKLATLPSNDPLPPLPQTGWEETTLIAAPMATNPAQFIRDLMPHNLPLAARCAASPEVKIEDDFKREIQEALIARTQDMQTDLRARISAGEALGVLGDPRFILQHGEHGAYLLPPLVKIAGDTYPIGDDNSGYDFERPAHTVKLSSFEIGKFPVTNAEYAKFMAAGGYEDEQWWDTLEAQEWRIKGGGEARKQSERDFRKTLQSVPESRINEMLQKDQITPKQAEDWTTIRNWTKEEHDQWLKEIISEGVHRQPEYWGDTRFNNPAQPVVGVTWFEARAYCNWLAANTGQTFRLPTEVEFEAAARGKRGRIYPYGKQFDAARSNTFESHIRRTTPVGIFDNATPEGAFDLSGNAYTWTLSIYDQQQFPYPYHNDDEREDIRATGVRRVLRGGSWFDHYVHARAAFRVNNVPAVRNYNFGFRVCRVGRPPSLLL
jgi:formylglycine-generating enzyme required for sulfatase activity